ncbi:MAG: class I SAM-dependent methyltransferase [Methanobacteriota archaeon]|nr:MAG: class I SAM-dependent methyltransferase [Euryarchaeota archaeon]
MPLPPDLAFSSKGAEYERESLHNPIVRFTRRQVYSHILRLRKPPAKILEINAGSGFDALNLARMGYSVLATDSAPGMVDMIKSKTHPNLKGEQMSFLNLDLDQTFDIILSNFGGLNTTPHLAKVFKQFPYLLNEGGFAILTILNPFCLWEFANLPWSWKTATRRLNWFKKKPVKANIDGHSVNTYYYSPSQIRNAMPLFMEYVGIQGLSTFVPPPYMNHIPAKYPNFYRFLEKIEKRLAFYWPFTHVGDYFIITFRKMPLASRNMILYSRWPGFD